MGNRVVETVYGRFHKYEIVKRDGFLLGSPTFAIHRDGAWYRGSYASLAAAVEAARRLG